MNIIELVHEQRPQFLKVLSDNTIDFEREAAFAIQILQGNDYLRGVALKNPDSIRNAVNNVAAIGISLNPASKLAYLVPRKGSVCLDISYMGLMHIAQHCGAIQWGQAVLVRQKDTFEMGEVGTRPTHGYNPFDADRGPLVGVYVVVKTDSGDYLTHAMSIADVYAIRDRSEAWKSYQKDKSKTCPWVTDEGEMVKKTCVKQAAKYWPRRERLDSAVHHVNTEGGEGIDVTPEKMPEDEAAKFNERILAATTKDALDAIWKEAVVICRELGDRTTYDTLKAAVLKQAKFIDESAKEVAKEAA